MKHIVGLAASFAFFAATLPISAQNSPASKPSNGVPGSTGSAVPRQIDPMIFQRNVTGSCPVSLRAQHGADGGIRNVDKAKPGGVAQLLHLILTSKDSRQIVEARLRVRGVSPKPRMSDADNIAGSADTTKLVSVRFKPSGQNEVTGNAWVPGLSAVLEVELNAITFSDGSMQRFSQTDGCRFTPDHLMLITDNSH